MAIDRLFKYKSASKRQTKFTFNREVSEVFEDMVKRSVPFYEEVNRLSIQTINQLIQPRGIVVDLGCSTGHFLIQLALNSKSKKYTLIGIDSSASMLLQAQKTLSQFIRKPKIQFIEADMLSLDLPPCDAVILNYSLQFIPKSQRLPLLKLIYASLKIGGLIILSEKVNLSNPKLEFHHFDYKRQRGYSELEISRKRESIEEVLIPNDLIGNISLLKKSQFKHIDVLFHWVKFSTLIAVKM